MKWRRRKYLIDEKFQWRFVGRLIMPLVLGVVTITVVDYYFIWSLFTSPVPGHYENMGLVTFKISMYLLLYGLCIFIPVVAIVGIIISHRVAGPLFNIERILKNIGEGELASRAVLRRKDELKNLAVCVNEMALGLANKISSIEEEVKALGDGLLGLESESEKELPNINRIREAIKSLNSSFAALKTELNKFKK